MTANDILDLLGEYAPSHIVKEEDGNFVIQLIGVGGEVLLERIIDSETSERIVRKYIKDHLYNIRRFQYVPNGGIQESYFSVEEVVVVEYKIRYDADAMRRMGYNSIEEYVDGERMSPFSLEGEGVIQEITHNENLDFVETREDSMEFYD
jgi:hypothetical protein